MTRIELEERNGASGLMALLVAVLEILVETMEREAVRRMESGALTADEIERLGRQLQGIEEEIASIKEREDIDDDVNRLRQDLDDIVDDLVLQTQMEERMIHE